MGPWLLCADAFRTVTGSSGGAICSEAVQFVQRLIAMAIHCVWLLLCVSHVEICSTIVAVWASCYVKQAWHTWQFWKYARNTLAPLLLVAFTSAVLAHLLGVGECSKFQVQVEFTHELFLFGNELVFGIFEYLNLAQHFATTESSSFVTYPHLLNKIIANYQ